MGSSIGRGIWGLLSLSVGITLFWGIGGIPLLSKWDPPVLAQTISEPEVTPEQVTLFAKTVLAIEPFRIDAQQRSESTRDPEAKDQIRREFIRKATEIITNNGMAIPDYNLVTLRLRSPEGQNLRRQIEREIADLQRENPQSASPVPSPSSSP